MKIKQFIVRDNNFKIIEIIEEIVDEDGILNRQVMKYDDKEMLIYRLTTKYNHDTRLSYNTDLTGHYLVKPY